METICACMAQLDILPKFLTKLDVGYEGGSFSASLTEDAQTSARGVHVAQSKRGQLTDPHPGCKQQGERKRRVRTDRVPHAHQLLQVARLETAREPGRQPDAELGLRERGYVEYVAPYEPREKRTQARETSLDRRRSEMPVLGKAIAITQDVGRRNGLHRASAAREGLELCQVLLIRTQGIVGKVFLFGAIAEKCVGGRGNAHGIEPPWEYVLRTGVHPTGWRRLTAE